MLVRIILKFTMDDNLHLSGSDTIAGFHYEYNFSPICQFVKYVLLPFFLIEI